MWKLWKENILKMRLEQNVKNAFQTCEKSVKNGG